MSNKEQLTSKRDLLEFILSDTSHLDKNDPYYSIYIDETMNELFQIEKELKK
ncbi:hypothetical protein [uncultured Metabacillus sp.]|uniref:hypothetical protein n=1 Tax=uncultured Metabacillus sp. TaxID=2860135 RepID=UPI0026383D4A|nr:hypothetical protein [uncultured Metabacillus sp.]